MNTIILSEEIIVGKHITYYASSSTKQDCDRIESIATRDLANSELRKLVNNENAILIAVGDGMKLSAYKIEPILDKLPNGDFRCYDVPLEQQIKSSNLVKLCEAPDTCWQSALRRIGYREVSGLRTPAYYTAYTFIWKIVN